MRATELTKCPHRKIETWLLEDSGEVAGLWSCVDCGRKFEPMVATQASPAAEPAETTEPEKLLPHAYLFAKVAMVMPLFEEARDALTAIREDQRIRHGIRKDLADRMDVAGTYSLDDWEKRNG